ncbi:hypothetical protein [Ottowia sp.]|uniref:hypothetical protein n=1 Tax=Ottowia sp. TaxID=1898956 RepID=UPI002C927440|nr:hypothetical protein [Ottowia sp.]HRN77111.1 hypothetical protein [Ottowia sp.]HRQ03119.1 hypothetical protein [Ottowia sp.]
MPTPAGGVPAAGGTRTAWLLFAPPLAALGLRWWLRARAELDPSSWQALRAAGDAPLESGLLLWQASQPFLIAVTVLALLVLGTWVLVRRFGWRRVRPVAAAAWIVLWAALAGAAGLQHVNRVAQQALPVQTATVLQVRPQPPSERGPGGAEVLLRLPGFEVPQSVLLELADAAALPPGSRLQLALARGRFDGDYVIGWRPAP